MKNSFMRNVHRLFAMLLSGLMMLFSSTIFTSCTDSEHDGYTYNEQYNFYYKLHSFSDTYRVAKQYDYVTALLSFRLPDADTAAFEGEYDIYIADTTGFACLFNGVHVGDSISYIVPYEMLQSEGLFPEEYMGLSLASEIRIDVAIHSILDSEAFYQHKKEVHLWQETKQGYEQYLIEQYIRQHKQSYKKLAGGIYKRIIKKGKGAKPIQNDYVSINYQGSFLNGEILNHFMTQDFVYGAPGQVLDGITMVLATMKAGERAQVILPSQFAWGEEGSSDGSVKPYTPIVYDIELTSVSR